MTRRLSMTTRRELTEAIGERYRRSDRNEKHQILDEFVALTGYHRKHAIRVLCRESQPPGTKPGPQRRYDDEDRAFSGQRRRAGGVGNAIRRAVPIRTFTDWNDPLPGYLEV